MQINLHDPASVILAVAAFGLVLSLWCAVILIWQARQSVRSERVRRRLGIDGKTEETEGRVLRLWRGESEESTFIAGSAPKVFSWFERFLADGGWDSPPRTMAFMLCGIFGIAFVATVAATGSILLGLGVVLAVTQVLWIYAQQRVTKRVALFERQLVDALELAARSLRVGHPLVGSFQLISEEVAAPVGPVFAEIVQQQGLGTSLENAIRRASEELPNPDLKLFATSVIIQLRSGGNLADMMERLAYILRERMRLARRVRVLTAQTQLSKRLLLAMPLITVVLLNLINPQYMHPMWSTTGGRIMVMVAAGGLLLGAWMMSVLAAPKS